MIVQHNMLSERAEGFFKKVNRANGRALEKLTSGYQINRAADGAAELSASEQFRAQVRGLGKAGSNIQDGNSLLQTADAALGEINNVLNRMRELCVQAANDTNVDEDRKAIQDEIDQMSECIDSILNQTEFNTKRIFRLGDGFTTYVESVVGSLPASVKVSGNLQTGNFPPLSPTTGANYAFASIDFSAIQTAADVQALIDTGFFSTCCTCDEKYNIRFVDNNSTPSQNAGKNPVFDVNIDGLTNGAQVVEAIVKAVNTRHYTEFMVDPDNPFNLYIYDYRENQQAYPQSGRGVLRPDLIRTEAIVEEEASRMNVQTGANSRQLVALNLPTLSAATLGVSTLGVGSNRAAGTALERVDMATDLINHERAKIGAMQERLDHAYDNARNEEVNHQDSESRIRDADMAMNMVENSKTNILIEVSESMMAQANRMTDAVLGMLE